MANADQNSASAPSINADSSDAQCLFDLESLERLHCGEAELEPEPVPSLPIPKPRATRRTQSQMAAARNDASLFGPKGTDPRSELGQDKTDVATLLAIPAAAHRVLIITTEKQPIRGLQPINTAAETLSPSANEVLEVLRASANQHVEVTEAGVQVEYQLATIGRSELRKRTGLNRSTVRRGILVLVERHLVVLQEKSEAYERKPAIYRICDPDAAAETMRSEDGLSGWRQKGRGRVVVPATKS
jgi:DNA-binding transcriptional ArsR family regulator